MFRHTIPSFGIVKFGKDQGMKKFIVGCLLVISFSVMRAQLVDSIYPEMNSWDRYPANFILQCHQLSDTSFLIINRYNDMYAINLSGVIMWKQDIPSSDSLPSVIANSSANPGKYAEQLYLTYYLNDCEKRGELQRVIFDIETRSFQTILGTPRLEERILFQRQPGLPQYAYATDSSLVIVYDADSLVELGPFQHKPFYEIGADGKIMVFANDSILLYQVNMTGVSLQNQLEDHVQYRIYWMAFASDSTLIVNTDEAILLVDLAWNTIREVPIPETKFYPTIHDRQWQDPYVIIDMPYYGLDSIVVLNSELDFELTIRGPLESSMDEMIYYGDSLLLVTGEAYGFLNSHSFIKAFDFSEEYDNSITDVGIVDVTHDYAVMLDTIPCADTELQRNQWINMQVEIINTGNTVIDSVVISSAFSSCPVGCGIEKFYRRTFHQLNLEPGQTQILSLGDVEIMNLNLSPDIEACMMVLLPDNRTDIISTNNITCVYRTVSATEVAENEIDLYPNPVHDQFFIKGDGMYSISIFDMQGRICFQQEHTISDQAINVKDLQSGMYILHIADEKGNVHAEKVIIE